jgi:predicted ribosomally synthesized peptide with nif11-like leader
LIKKALKFRGNNKKHNVSKAQLTAFLAKVEANPALKIQVDAAADASAVAAIAQTEGFAFSPASLARHLRG